MNSAGTHVARPRANTFLMEFPAVQSPTDDIYLIDPLSNLMLRFPSEPDAQRMMKDLARLLRVSRVG